MGKIEKGLLTVNKIGEADVIVDLIPWSNTTSRPGYGMEPTSITIHNTGNKNADAEDHTNYIDAAEGYVSWHFTVDDEEIFQELPITENAWHAGDGGSGPGNRTSIAIEICEHEGINWNVAKYNAIKLVVLLLKELDLTPEAVVPHQEWSGKYCPHKILDEGWEFFMDLVEKEYNSTEADYSDLPEWTRGAMAWAVESGINDGVVQNETELQTMVFLHRYHMKYGKEA